MVTFIGENFSARDACGEIKVRIATVFPYARTIVTEGNTHADQRQIYVDNLIRNLAEQGKPALSDGEQDAAMEMSVDLLVDEKAILIRPNPTQMELAFEADELLEEAAPNRRVKYLFLSDPRVRESLKRRGECWRIFLPPSAPEQIRKLITESKSAIDGRAIYYYSPTTGTRLLTYDNIVKLGKLDDTDLRRHCAEIAAYANRRNRNGYPELDFFQARHNIETGQFEQLSACPDEELRPRFAALCKRLESEFSLEYRVDDPDDATWRKRMFEVLMAQRDAAPMDEQTIALDPDFSMRVEWLPGGRIEEGELIMHTAADDAITSGPEKRAASMVRALILNLVQEYGDLEYINMGSVLPSPKRNPLRKGRREVYVAQMKQRRASAEVLQIIRMQKWGVRERLDDSDSLEDAMMRTEEYAEYIMDRRLACRQLGMNLPQRTIMRKVSEIYDGNNRRYAGYRIWTPYFQRDYIAGFGTDQLPPRKLADNAYAMIFARLLGQAAAPNLILGRAELTGEVVFDVGDEIVSEDSTGMPSEIVVSDHVGTFVDWRGTLQSRAPAYAAAIARHLPIIGNRREVIEAYLAGFIERFIRIQEEYARHRRAFDTLFKHRPWNTEGAPSYRWSCVLDRLRNADPQALSELIRAAIPM